MRNSWLIKRTDRICTNSKMRGHLNGRVVSVSRSCICVYFRILYRDRPGSCPGVACCFTKEGIKTGDIVVWDSDTSKIIEVLESQ
jgi:hypothetical protein